MKTLTLCTLILIALSAHADDEAYDETYFERYWWLKPHSENAGEGFVTLPGMDTWVILGAVKPPTHYDSKPGDPPMDTPKAETPQQKPPVETPRKVEIPQPPIAVEPPRIDDPRKTKIKLARSGSSLYISATLNGAVSAAFVIDTGASEIIINSTLARKLIEVGAIADNDWIKGRIYSMADGSVAVGRRFILRTVRIGDKEIHDVECGILDTKDAGLLFGFSALKKLGRYTIDSEMAELEF